MSVTNVITKFEMLKVHNSIHDELDAKLNNALEHHIRTRLGNSISDNLKDNLKVKSHLHDCHMAGAIDAGVLGFNDLDNAATIRMNAWDRYPAAVKLTEDVYKMRKDGAPEKEIEKILYPKINSLLPSNSVETGVSAAVQMELIAAKHGQSEFKAKAWNAYSVMEEIAARTKKK